PTHPKLTLALLSDQLNHGEPPLQLEAARALCEVSTPRRFAVLLEAARNRRLGDVVPAQALAGLSEHAEEYLDQLLAFARGTDAGLREEARRARVNVRLNAAHRSALDEVAGQRPGRDRKPRPWAPGSWASPAGPTGLRRRTSMPG